MKRLITRVAPVAVAVALATGTVFATAVPANAVGAGPVTIGAKTLAVQVGSSTGKLVLKPSGKTKIVAPQSGNVYYYKSYTFKAETNKGRVLYSTTIDYKAEATFLDQFEASHGSFFNQTSYLKVVKAMAHPTTSSEKTTESDIWNNYAGRLY